MFTSPPDCLLDGHQIVRRMSARNQQIIYPKYTFSHMYIIGRKIKVNKKSEETCILEMTFGGHGEKHAGIWEQGREWDGTKTRTGNYGNSRSGQFHQISGNQRTRGETGGNS